MKIKSALLIASLLISSCSLKEKQENVAHTEIKSNQFWWPKKIDLSPLRAHSIQSNPYGENFDYAKEFTKVDIDQLKKDIEAVMLTSQDWWPADYGNYGPFFIRMAWHSAGTYRVSDGRGGADGGQQRFEPLNSWPDNASLDKARRLLWPVKKKYGKQVSWSDLMALSGNVALESMGFKNIGFAGGRVDDWEADMVYWGPEDKFLASTRHQGKRDLDKPLAATRMGLIYVNPEGPNGNPDPILAAHDIRQTFGQMAMNDEETVALIAGGHTFGKAHGAVKDKCLKAEPAAAPLEEQGLGWKNVCGKGHSEDTMTSGLEGAWTMNPTMWTTQYLDNLFNFEWVPTRSPAGLIQWKPKDKNAANLVIDAHTSKRHAPMMFTTDLSLKFDPEYKKIAKRFQENPKEFEKAFAKAWFKLIHRDMGPKARYVGKDAPKTAFSWQDPLPKANYKQIDAIDINILKTKISNSNLTVQQLVKAAWASASSFRATDMRGGANGARIRLEPQKNWELNNPKELAKTLSKLEEIQKDFNKDLKNGKKVSLADVIVLGGAVGVEKAAKKAGVSVKVPFKIGRVDATQSQTDIASFNDIKPKADGFRNYYSKNYLSPVNALIDRADTLNLTVPEMTVLIGGMRVLGANYDNSDYGVLTKNKGALSNDFFVNLLDMSTKWQKSLENENLYQGICRKSSKVKWQATSVDLIFGSNSELRAVAEAYGANDAKEKFVQDFVKAWVKVMQADRFDLKK